MREKLARSCKVKVTPVLLLACLGLVSSCSFLSKRQVDEDGAGEEVSLKEHQELKQRYSDLAKRYDLLQQELNSGPAEQEGPQILDDLNDAPDSADLAETVDVFAKQQAGETSKAQQQQQQQSKSKASSKPRLKSEDLDEDLIEEQILSIRRIEEFVSENRFDEGLREIKKLENSPVDQVRVRAKFYLGEILFKQEEYDLAMQIYEEIIQQDAFSGIVIKSLGRLIICSENLKLDQKRDTYYSILHDFFERG